MSDYPGAIDEFRTTQNLPGILYDEADTTTVYAEDTNNITSAIVAIENTLGTNPDGTFANVADRLDNIDASHVVLEVSHQGVVPIPTATYVTVPYDTVTVDSAGGWNNSTHRYTIPSTGMYIIAASSWYGTTFTAGDKKIIIGRNYTESRAANNSQLIAYETQQINGQIYLNENDVIEIWLSQNSGATQYTDDYHSVSYLNIARVW